MPHRVFILCLTSLLSVSCGEAEETNPAQTNPCDSASNPDCDSGSASTTTESSTESNTSDSGTEGNEDVIRILPFSCFIGPSPCDPRSGEGCAEGETCDFSSESELGCFPPPNTAAVGEACDNSAGPYCAVGGWCAPDSITGEPFCHQVCCFDSECSAPGLECAGIFTDPNIGSLGLCKFPSEESDDDEAPGDCLPSGASCSTTDDQCCGYCHVGHCH